MFKTKIKIQDDDGNWLVPNEVLLHILRFIPNRQNFGMTCKKIYGLNCGIERNTRPLRVNSEVVRIPSIDWRQLLNMSLPNSSTMTRFSSRSSIPGASSILF